MMVEPAFSPQTEKALDAYALPSVPQGFSERLMARIASGDTDVNAAPVTLPVSRQRRTSPWRRTGRILGVVATFSLATATAAAAGIFGKPVYVPGVSEALVEAKIVETPTAVTKPKMRIIAENTPERAVAKTPAATGSAAVIDRIAELRNNTEFAKLPPRQRLSVAGREVRRMVRTGEVTRDDARTAVRELANNADPAAKEAWRKAAAERRESFRDATPEQRAAIIQELRERRQARQQALAPSLPPSPPDEAP